MLKLRYFPAAVPVRAFSLGADTLGVIAYGIENNFPGADAFVMSRCIVEGTDATAIEAWSGTQAVTAAQSDALHYRYNDEVLFGCIVLDEATFAASADRSALQSATHSAYSQLFALLDRLQLPLWRIWNFIPRINAHEHGLERYRHFNIARQAAFVASGRALAGNVPAASAVGTRDTDKNSGGELIIYFLAGRAAPLAIENPRQLSAYHYPADYGPRSPIFSRASLIDTGAQELLFISGTASIVGHRTLHAGDVIAQARELLANIDCVLAESNRQTKRRQFTRRDLTYKVYLRHATDFDAVKTQLEHWLGDRAPALYLQADICRAELLVEIEASGGHEIEMHDMETEIHNVETIAV